MAEVSEEQVQASLKLQQSVEAINKAYEKSLEVVTKEKTLREQVQKTIEAEEEKQRQINELKQKSAELLRIENELREKNRQLKVAENEAAKKAIQSEINNLEVLKEKEDELHKLKLQQVDKELNLQKKLKEAKDKAHEEEIKQLQAASNMLKNLGQMATNAGNSLLEGFNFPILGVKIKGMRELITDVIKAPAEAFKKYGFLDQYASSIDNMRQSMLGAGIGEQQMYEAFGDLNQVVADFPTYSRGAQEQLVGTSAKLALAGFNSKTTATSFNNLVKVFGQTATQANNTNIRLAALSKTLGDGSKTFEDFTALTPKLTGFGGKAVDVFEKTSIAAKKLGMDTKELFGIMDQYDSFENAANAAGELNVALGGQFIDSLELMKASIEGGPTDVLNLLQKSFKESGVQVENLSRAQLKYFASAAKIPEDQFKKIFAAGGQGVDDYIQQQEIAAKKQEDLNKIAQRTQDVFQQIQNAFAAAFSDKKNVDALVKVALTIKDIGLALANGMKIVKSFAPLLAGLFATGAILSFSGAILGVIATLKALKAASLGSAIAQAFLKALSGPAGWVALGLGVAGGVAAAATMSSLIGDETGEGKSTAAAASASISGAGVAQTAAAEPPMPVHQDAFAPGGSMITTPQGGKFKTSAQDSVIAAKDGGVLAEKLNEISGLLREYLERPVPVMLDGKKVNSELARANKYNPFTA